MSPKRQTPAGIVSSMTGFGRASSSRAGVTIEVELKTVNSRYLDLNFRLPRGYSVFERDLRTVLQSYFSRGRVELVVLRTVTEESGLELKFDAVLFQALLKSYKEAASQVGSWELLKERALGDILQRRDVLDTESLTHNEELEQALLIEVVRAAAAHVVEMRQKEGAALQQDIVQRLSSTREITRAIDACVEKSVPKRKELLEQRISELSPEALGDPQRLATEIALIADKIDVREELVRLDSHCAQFEKILRSPPCGRKLDFLLQEFGRELNTISSKAQDAEVQAFVVDARMEVERMREQVQNLE